MVEPDAQQSRFRQTVLERQVDQELMVVTRTIRILLVAVGLATVADAAQAEGRNVLSANDVNMRSGPAGSYRKIVKVSGNQIVTVHGCARGFSWCDVDWAGYRGWVSAKFLRLPGMTGGLAGLAPDLGIPAVGYDGAEYESAHYSIRAEPAGIQLVPQASSDDATAVPTGGTDHRPAANSDLLGGEIAK